MDLNNIAYCGIDCNTCKNYKQNANCQGCRVDETLLSDCFTIGCCREKNIDFCSQCATFPCTEMKEFYDSAPHRKKGFENLKSL